MHAEAYLGEGGIWAISPHLWSQKYENSQQKRVFNNTFVILGGRGPSCGQFKINYFEIEINLNGIKIMNVSENLKSICWWI